jgi:hypothetical protein
VGFPLLLLGSVLLSYGLPSALIVAAASLLGLVSAYGIQRCLLGGRPLPALAPISLLSLVGLVVVHLASV